MAPVKNGRGAPPVRVGRDAHRGARQLASGCSGVGSRMLRWRLCVPQGCKPSKCSLTECVINVNSNMCLLRKLDFTG